MELNEPKWKNVTKTDYNLADEVLFFVNREEAVKQLNRIHLNNYRRAKRTAGRDWIIPIADHVFGLGKSEFGSHYIEKTKQQWAKLDTKDDFQETLSSCHTIKISLASGSLLDSNYDQVMLDHLIPVINDAFTFPPNIVPKNSTNFLRNFTSKYGPVFIVLDEIGAAFSYADADDAKKDDDLKKRARFFSFCKNVLSSWLAVKNVFFLLCGAESFFSYVGFRLTERNLSGSPFRFERINLHLLRTPAIKQILENTKMSNTDPSYIKDFLHLNESETLQLSRALFEKTNGHPRSLLQALVYCCTSGASSFNALLEKIKDYELELNLFDKEDEFIHYVNSCKNEIRDLLKSFEEQEKVDLTRLVEMNGKMVPRFNIVNNCLISWEGTMNQATLFAPKKVLDILRWIVLPFKEYLVEIAKVNKLSLPYPTLFEWMCLKRFQELFPVNQAHLNPNDKEIRKMFLSSSKLGPLIKKLVLSSKFLQTPKVTGSGKRDVIDMNSLTCVPEDWKEIFKSVNIKYPDICLKPRPQSSSSDVYFLTNVTDESGKNIKVTIGLGIKNYSRAKLNKDQLLQECELFNRTFDNDDLKDRLNILIICCTNYDDNIKVALDDNYFYQWQESSFPCIHEILLLNLTSVEKRSLFFGVQDQLEGIVEEVIEKREKELNHSENVSNL